MLGKYYFYSKEPEWDEIGDNAAMAKVISDRDIAAVVQEHEKMCEEAIVEAKHDKKRIEKLRAMQKDLREKFIETNKFINDCQAKCAVLDKKIAAESEAEQILQHDIDDIDERIKDLTEFHEVSFIYLIPSCWNGRRRTALPD